MTGLSTAYSRAAGAKDQSSPPHTNAVPISFRGTWREIASRVPETSTLDTTAGKDANGIRLMMYVPIGRVSRATSDALPEAFG